MMKATVVSRLRILPNCRRSLFTNAEKMKRHDPYALLGLTWGASTTEIKEAYKQKAREYHPDLNPENPQAAVRKFQAVHDAYQKLMDVKGAPHRDDLMEEWSFAVWRNGDIIAQERTDVAGVSKKRPAKPADLVRNLSWGVAALGHPSGGGISLKRGEFLTSGLKSSTVGTGRSKWVTPKEFRPWNPEQVELKRANVSRPSSVQRPKGL
jgi:hypothetical protein